MSMVKEWRGEECDKGYIVFDSIFYNRDCTLFISISYCTK